MNAFKRIRLFAVAALFSALALGSFVNAEGQTSDASRRIVIDRDSAGRVFDGVGAISGGGGNSRLLIDYPEPYRGQILDYLFKPNFGAGMQILKVEIGADMDSTDGSEASHMHTRSDEDYQRGYEWWLMEEAKKRNPNIKLVALPWGAPHWVGDGNYWSHDMIEYIIKWIKHAQSDHHLTIDYVGGRNEHGYDAKWYKDFKAALRANGLGSVKVIASDDWEKVKLWNIAREMKKDPALNDSIDIVGVHGPGWGGYPPPEALALGKPLWDSEAHFDEKPPYNEIARNINRNYVAGRITANIYWPIVSAMYDNLPYDDIGFIKSNQPWSGHYVVTPSLWVMAHTAQFTQPGWSYIDGASGFFAADSTGAHGSYVALESPDRSHFSLIIETVETREPQTVHFKLKGFAAKALNVWVTDLESSDPASWFMHRGGIHPIDGEFSLNLQPGHMITVTTTTGQSRGYFAAPPSSAFPFPYAENFDSYGVGKMPRYFSDMVGGFETVACQGGGRAGVCLRQVVNAEPTSWKQTAQRPFTMLGNLHWQDYKVSSDVLLEQPGSVDLIGRLSGMSGTDVPNSYVLRVADTGEWSLIKTAVLTDPHEDISKEESMLAQGTVNPLGTGQWHHVALSFKAAQITAEIDGVGVSEITDSSFTAGMVGLGTKGYIAAEFDNFRVEPVPHP